MEFRQLKKEDLAAFKSLIEIYNTVFEHDKKLPSDSYLLKILSQQNFWVIVASQVNEIVGGLTIHILHTCYHEKPLAYIYDIGIKPSFQGQGIGKALVSYTLELCKEKGCQEAYVEAEADDADALHFYRKTKYSSELKAIHFNYDWDTK
jgi:aminoglycoside 3-N-acetyltransferase I